MKWKKLKVMIWFDLNLVFFSEKKKKEVYFTICLCRSLCPSVCDFYQLNQIKSLNDCACVCVCEDKVIIDLKKNSIRWWWCFFF